MKISLIIQAVWQSARMHVHLTIKKQTAMAMVVRGALHRENATALRTAIYAGQTSAMMRAQGTVWQAPSLKKDALM